MPFININSCLETTSSLKIGQCKFFLMACIFYIYSPELSYCPSVCLKGKKKADVQVTQKLCWRSVLSGCSSLWPTSAVGCQITTKIISKKWFPNVQRILLSSRQKKREYINASLELVCHSVLSGAHPGPSLILFSAFLHALTTLIVSGAVLCLAVIIPTYKKHCVMPDWFGRALVSLSNFIVIIW